MKTLYNLGEVAAHRKYKESDIMVFRKVINLKNDTDMTLENTKKQIVLWHQGVEVLPLNRHEVKLIDI
ncbi:hypothetical protein BK744_09130 [Bacillus thuringiensis serovar zhaodongensis]|nr:hypothetical protein BK744_09130 [Bacillus thuringiensis serovar zhaodongensis]